jgi:serine/threonine-protein kinase
MGIVYEAYHELLGLEVAIKLLHPDIAEDDRAATRLLHEARAAASIDNEHITRVSEVGMLESGTPFLVMERLHGSDFERLLRERGPLPIAEAVDYVVEALEAVAAAHATGIVHRDLKPSNLFLARRKDDTSIVKVLDFGISKRLAHPTGSPAGSVTMTGSILGSPAYMAPEQLRSAKDVDRRADIWSMGVILCELLTVKSPFARGHPVHVLAAILEDEPAPPRELRREIGEGLEAVILRCLRRDRRARFAGARELAEALAPFGSQQATHSLAHIREVSRDSSNEAASRSASEKGEPEAAAREAIARQRATIADQRSLAQERAVVPFLRVFELGSRGRHTRSVLGALTTVLAHGGMATAIVFYGDLTTWTRPLEMRELSIELEADKVAPPPKPFSHPEPHSSPKKVGSSDPDPALPDNPPQGDPTEEPSQGGTLLTRDRDEEDNPVDDSYMTAESDLYAGGITTRIGRFNLAGYRAGSPLGWTPGEGWSLRGGQPGAKGFGDPSKPTALDRSRPAWLHTNVTWDCGFPWEAGDRINYAAVQLAVTVKPDGTPESAEVVSDPGHGFGRVAKLCALNQHFIPALDHDGQPLTATTRPFTVGFRRQ